MSREHVPCPCPSCRGKLVSHYVRKQHVNILVPHKHLEGASDSEHIYRGGSEVLDPLPPDLGCDSAECTESDVVNSESDSLSSECSQLEFDPDIAVPDDPESDINPLLSSEIEMHSSGSPLYDMSIYEGDIFKVPLYEGANISLLEALVGHFSWFSEHPGISKAALSDIFQMQHSQMLPPGNCLPDTYETAIKVIEPLLIKPIEFHACPNDCIVFRGENLHLDCCPVCQASRFNKPGVPAKRFIYLPIGPRLERMFCTASISELLQSHINRDYCEKLFDIQDSQSWKSAYSATGIFRGDPRGISLSLCTDGVNPFSHNRVSYSMWPIVMAILNLPRNIRLSFGNLLLVGIVPGNGTKEAYNLDPYLNIVVDEMLELSNRQAFDAYKQAPFMMKVQLLLYILDYPAIGKVFNVIGSGGYQACTWCEIQGTYNKDLTKMIYLQNRRYLPLSSKLREDGKHFPEKGKEMRLPPPTRDYERIKSLHISYDSMKTKASAAAVAKATGCKSSYCFMKLPFHNRLTQCNPDGMHTIKDVVEHIYNLIIGREDSAKVRTSEIAAKRFGLKRTRDGAQIRKKGLPPAPFRLSVEDIKVANGRAGSVSLPSPDFTPGAIFTRTTGLKSHDWKELATKGILKFCLRGMLHSKQRKSLFFFLDTITLLTAEVQSSTFLDDLEERVHLALAMMERDFPMSIQVTVMHLMHHLVKGIKAHGPLYGTWMFPYERFNSWLHRRVMNRSRPEATLIETYRIFEWCQYMKFSGRVPMDVSMSTDSTSNITCNLSASELSLLDTLYKKMLPQYRHLCEEYEKAITLAVNARKKSLFPSRTDWQPVCGFKDANDHLLFQGPKPVINEKKKLEYEHKSIGKKYVLVSREYEPIHTSGRHLCSIVQVLQQQQQQQQQQEPDSKHVVAYIKKLFTHQFGKDQYKLALLRVYSDVEKDEDGLFWSEVNKFEPESSILPVHWLSSPLAVGFEGNRIYFLNSV